MRAKWMMVSACMHGWLHVCMWCVAPVMDAWILWCMDPVMGAWILWCVDPVMDAWVLLCMDPVGS